MQDVRSEPPEKGGGMPLKMESDLRVGKVVEISATSTKSFEDAIASAEMRKGVENAWVEMRKAFESATAKFK